MTDYESFLASKFRGVPECGFDPDHLAGFLYPFQSRIEEWALRKGRAAIFADCGLGKTPIQIEWARQVHEHTDKPVLIFAPLAVSEQTKREGEKFGIPVRVVTDQSEITAGINITNYEKIHHFTPAGIGGLVLDESGILKSYGGFYRQELTEFTEQIPYRLACTATPAPNDIIEIINHAEFLGVNRVKEIIALFFRQDGNTTHKCRIKGHAKSDFWRWLASWAIACRMPSDLGYDNGEFVLPELNYIQHTTDGHIQDGLLFPIEAITIPERRQARRESIEARVGVCADLANSSSEPWLIWCGLNDESQALRRAIPDAVDVSGSDPNDVKAERMLGFSDGKYRVLVTKPSIAGWGMNWQHCAHEAFVGLSDSWEQYYQAVRRCWRFGQTRPVTVHVVVAETEGAVVDNIRRKERNANMMMAELVAHMGSEYTQFKEDYDGVEMAGVPAWIGAE